LADQRISPAAEHKSGQIRYTARGHAHRGCLRRAPIPSRVHPTDGHLTKGKKTYERGAS